MKIETAYSFYVILVCAAATLLTRALPFIVFSREKTPEFIKYLSAVLPRTIMVILVLYCLRGTVFSERPYGAGEILSCLAVWGAHSVSRNMYVSIIAGTVCYMLLTRLL